MDRTGENVNRLCASCSLECKQPSCVQVLMCPKYRPADGRDIAGAKHDQKQGNAE